LGQGNVSAAAAFEEGNSVDRAVYILLIILAISVLSLRSFKWAAFAVKYKWFAAMVVYSFASFLWSDFPLITFKRCTRDFGVYLVILIALSDPRPVDAICGLMRRLSFLLIPLSIVLIKYYPDMGIGYDIWTGVPDYTGVATSKNMLGVVCLTSGLYFFWDICRRWPKRSERRTRIAIVVSGFVFAQVLWLLTYSHSATSGTCLTLGCLIVLACQSRTVMQHPALLKIGIPILLCLYPLFELGIGIDLKAIVAEMVGRNPTLTGRTHIWEVVLGMPLNSAIGTGYESFWLGPRLRDVWRLAGGVNHAHNGYIELYLNLGFIGLGLLVMFLLSCYWHICKNLTTSTGLGSLRLALWTILLLYNVTEAAFKIQLLFVIFLLIVLEAPPRRRANSTAADWRNDQTTGLTQAPRPAIDEARYAGTKFVRSIVW
jgi:O-antigen ligase